jgi:hypothetical protein
MVTILLTVIAGYLALGIAVVSALNYGGHIEAGGALAKIMAVVLWPIVATVCYVMRDWRLW